MNGSPEEAGEVIWKYYKNKIHKDVNIHSINGNNHIWISLVRNKLSRDAREVILVVRCLRNVETRIILSRWINQVLFENFKFYILFVIHIHWFLSEWGIIMSIITDIAFVSISCIKSQYQKRIKVISSFSDLIKKNILKKIR